MKRWYIDLGIDYYLKDAIMQHLTSIKGVRRISRARKFYCRKEPKVITFTCDYKTAETIAHWLPESLRICLHWNDAEYPHQIAK